MFPVISRFYKGVIMSILFGIMLVFNVINPENRAFINQTLENNKKYECEFQWKGISSPIDRPAMTFGTGFTVFKQVCK